MSQTNKFAALQGVRYINLETFRKNGTGVQTPVWFASGPTSTPPETLYVYSTADSGKAKRIRNNSRVRVAPCDMRGRVLGDWIEAQAKIGTEAEAEVAMRLLNKKYVPWRQLLEFFSKFRPRPRIVFVIRPA